MNSQQDTPITVSSVILANPNNWDEWLKVIKSKANTNYIWKYINPSTPEDALPKLKEPVRVSPKDVNSQKTKLLKLDEDEKEELCILQFNYKDNLKLYKKQLLTLNMLHTQI